MKHTVIIVEDEVLARKTLRDMLADADWLEIIGEADDGVAAVELINTRKPDLVFLDINLPELPGLDVLKRLTHEPAVIFTTAHDRHAIAAFELAALDYLLKPFGRARLQRALARAKEALGEAETRPAVAAARAAPGAGDAPLERILIRDGGRIVPVAVRAKAKTFLVNLPLGDFETRLDAPRFVRMHRPHLVNLDFVETIDPFGNSQLRVRMKDGTKITASRTASKRLRALSL
ncbi:MAG: DNA-binding response regulator [Undibacterium sp.]|nr:DNA-binding response regulator [Opitutaceae bacterium]